MCARLDVLKQEISYYYSNLLYERGLVGAAGGNVSARFGSGVLITAGGVSLRDIRPDSVLLIDLEGRLAEDERGYKPSKETKMHLKVYESRADIDSVVHAHPAYATGISIRGVSLPMVTGTAELKLKAVPLVEFATPGSEQLALLVGRTIQSHGRDIKNLLLEKHGILSFEQGPRGPGGCKRGARSRKAG